MRACGGRAGVVLVLALLVLVAVGLVGASLAYVAGQQRLIATRRVDLLRARLAAEAGVVVALVDWVPGFEPPSGGAVPLPWAAGTLPGAGSHGAAAERLEGGLLLIRGEGEASGGGARAVAGLLAREPDLDSIAGLLGAALEAAGVVTLLQAALVDATSPEATPGSPAEGCGELSGSALAVALGEAAALVVDAGAQVVGEVGTGPAGLAAEALRRLLPSADHRIGGRVVPGPQVAGDACTDDAWNWGDPGSPSSACGTRFPFLHAPADLEIDGGVGQPLLFVAGDLLVRRGTELTGLIVVGGRLDIEAGARIRGAVVAGGAARVAGELRLSYCAAADALHASGASRPLPNPGRAWVPAF